MMKKASNLSCWFLVVSLLLLLSGCISSQRITFYHRQLFDLRDFDADGVVNAREQCAITPKGSVVDNVGCPTWREIKEYDEASIYFANASADISTKQLPVLQDFAHRLKQYPDSVLEISGYTSLPGGRQYNQMLSKERAENVRSTLIDNFSVNPDQLRTQWFGESKPVIRQISPEANKLNRRVVLLMVANVRLPTLKWSARIFPGSAFQ